MTRFQPQDPRNGEVLPPLDGPSPRSGTAAPAAVATASIVHDLGNLIQIATSAINIVSRTPEMPAVHAGPMLDRARTCLEHAGALVRQNLGRIRDSAAVEARSDVAACLADVAALVAAMDRPALVLAFDIESGLPAARCDPVGLRRALLNLVLNAADAMADTGRITIRARAIGCGADGAIELEVVDHGVGMTAATIARVFDPFFTTKRDGLGGIGLPMVKRFAREGGGAVAITSEPGIGTVVALRLPTNLAEESRP